MKKIVVVIVIVLGVVNLTYSQTDADYTRSLQTMFELAGIEETYQVAVEQMMEVFKQQYQGGGEELWNEMKTEFMNTSMTELVTMLTPIYQKYLTQSDLEDIIVFYRSPVGQKLGENTPKITQESMVVGQEWGMEIGRKLVERLEEKGK